MSDYKLFDTFQDSILMIDEHGRLVFGNHAASVLFEISAKRMASGKPLDQFVKFEPSPFAGFESLGEIREPTQMREIEFVSSSGKTGSAQVTIQPQPEYFATEEGEKRRWLVYLRDVSLERILHEKYRGELDQKEDVIRALQEARAKLEDYSRNLEKMVADRTVALSEANQLLQTILDSLRDGILVFDREGKCLPVFSKVCLKVLEGEPAGRHISEVLGLSGDDKEAFASWREAVFQQLLDFDDMIPLAPKAYRHSQNLEIALGYNLMKGTSGDVDGVVVVATDRTREVQALREAASEREHVKQVVQVAKNKEAFRIFVNDARGLLEDMKNGVEADREEIARRLHTLKGGAATFSLNGLASECHMLEETLKDVRDDVSSLAAFRARLSEAAALLSQELEGDVQDLAELLGLKVTRDLATLEFTKVTIDGWMRKLTEAGSPVTLKLAAEIARECREKPLGDTVQHYSGSLIELAERLGKKVLPVVVEGGDTRGPLDPLQPLLSSLVHAFRNSLDHGIELPHEREANGKPAEGKIVVAFGRLSNPRGDRLVIEIRDDGRGIDPEKIRSKLRSKGLNEVASGGDDEVIQAILRDDFSTADTITELSGRGVGLGAVAEEARRLGGTVRVNSVAGQGMSLRIDVPMPDVVPFEQIQKAA